MAYFFGQCGLHLFGHPFLVSVIVIDNLILFHTLCRYCSTKQRDAPEEKDVRHRSDIL